jgi:hypothetical protein
MKPSRAWQCLESPSAIAISTPGPLQGLMVPRSQLADFAIKMSRAHDLVVNANTLISAHVNFGPFHEFPFAHAVLCMSSRFTAV